MIQYGIMQVNNPESNLSDNKIPLLLNTQHKSDKIYCCNTVKLGGGK